MEENEEQNFFSRKELIVPIVENVPIIFVLKHRAVSLSSDGGDKLFKMADLRRAKGQIRNVYDFILGDLRDSSDLIAITHIFLVKPAKLLDSKYF